MRRECADFPPRLLVSPEPKTERLPENMAMGRNSAHRRPLSGAGGGPIKLTPLAIRYRLCIRPEGIVYFPRKVGTSNNSRRLTNVCTVRSQLPVLQRRTC